MSHKCVKCGSTGGPRRLLSAVKVNGKLVVMCSRHAALHYSWTANQNFGA